MGLIIITLTQLIGGLLIASAILGVLMLIWRPMRIISRFPASIHEPPSNIAIIEAASKWQYDDPYFDKISEFRNDFK